MAASLALAAWTYFRR